MGDMQCGKKLVVFFDGTWNRADQHTKDGKACPTNVVKLFEATLPQIRTRDHTTAT